MLSCVVLAIRILQQKFAHQQITTYVLIAEKMNVDYANVNFVVKNLMKWLIMLVILYVDLVIIGMGCAHFAIALIARHQIQILSTMIAITLAVKVASPNPANYALKYVKFAKQKEIIKRKGVIYIFIVLNAFKPLEKLWDKNA